LDGQLDINLFSKEIITAIIADWLNVPLENIVIDTVTTRALSDIEEQRRRLAERAVEEIGLTIKFTVRPTTTVSSGRVIDSLNLQENRKGITIKMAFKQLPSVVSLDFVFAKGQTGSAPTPTPGRETTDDDTESSNIPVIAGAAGGGVIVLALVVYFVLIRSSTVSPARKRAQYQPVQTKNLVFNRR
jgi:hypothetical protein